MHGEKGTNRINSISVFQACEKVWNKRPLFLLEAKLDNDILMI